MSKTALRKELKSMTKEQLETMLLDVYTACPDASEYLDFFLDPDVPKMEQKYQEMQFKEIRRSKRGRSLSRFSHLLANIKKYDKFGVGADKVVNLCIYTLSNAILFERFVYIRDAYVNGTERLAKFTLEYADRHRLADKVLALFEQIMEQPYSKNSESGDALRKALENHMANSLPPNT